MFSNIFRKGESASTVKSYSDRIAYLMQYLERHGQQPMEAVVASLKSDLLLEIRADARDPQEKIWIDPTHQDLGISIGCERMQGKECVKRFTITGYGAIANTLINGVAVDGENGTTQFMWTISTERGIRKVPDLSRKLHIRLWELPGYRKIGIGRVNFLMRT